MLAAITAAAGCCLPLTAAAEDFTPPLSSGAVRISLSDDPAEAAPPQVVVERDEPQAEGADSQLQPAAAPLSALPRSGAYAAWLESVRLSRDALTTAEPAGEQQPPPADSADAASASRADLKSNSAARPAGEGIIQLAAPTEDIAAQRGGGIIYASPYIGAAGPARATPSSFIRFAQPTPPEAPGFLPADLDESNPSALDDTIKPISLVGVSILSDQGELPPNYASARFMKAGEVFQPTGTSRNWELSNKNWVAPGLCYRPLRFEEVNLERHGYSFGYLQPPVSAFMFISRVPLLPYFATARPSWECTYVLGHYRPGTCAPFRLHRAPVRLDATAVTAAVWVGTAALFPTF